MSINYIEVNSRASHSLFSTKKHLTLIESTLKALIEIRVSQINGCAYCIDLHCNEARKSGVSQQKLDCLCVYKESLLFNDRETAALYWAECVTNITTQCDMDDKLNRLLEYFSEQEAVDLTLIISLMNCLNRMAISLGDKPAVRNT